MPHAALLETRPVRAAELTVGPPMLLGDRKVHLVKDCRDGRFYQIGPKEQFIIERLDGSHTLGQIGDAYQERFGRRLDDRSWGAILTAMWQRSFLATPDGSPRPTRPKEATTQGGAGSRWGSGSLSWGDPGPLLDRLHSRLAWLFSPAVSVLSMLTCVGLVAFTAVQAPTLWRQSRGMAAHPELAMLAGLLVWVGTGLHELGHGLWCRHYGGRATAIGIRWRLPLVMFYCEADDVLLFPSRRQRVSTAAVGSMVSLLFLLPFLALWLVLPAGDATHDAISGLLLYGTVQALLNYVPVLGLDGYLIVQSALNTVELGPQTWLFLRRWACRSPLAAGYPKRARRIYAGYTVLVAMLVTAVATGCVVLACTVLSGPATVTALAAVLLAALLPLLRRTAFHPAAESASAHDASPTPPTKGDPPVHQQDPSDPPRLTATGPPVVVVTDLHKRYGDVQAVAGTSFTVQRGEFLGVLGPNGAGKTTLIEIMAGQRRPDSGSVTVFGESPWPRRMSVNSRVGIQTQASSFFPELTALEHLETVAGLYGLPRAAAAQALERVGLTASGGVRVTGLSGGQRQRLAIASALVHGPDLLFLDEPTAALDPKARRELWALLRGIQSRGCSIVYTTHHLDEAEVLCDRIAIVQSGSVIALDTPRRLIVVHGGTERVLVPAELASVDRLGSLPGVAQARLNGRVIELSTAATAQVLAALGPVVDLTEVETRRPTLEDVYLNLTGREFVQ